MHATEARARTGGEVGLRSFIFQEVAAIAGVLGNVDCLPGRQVPRGLLRYLVEFELNYSPTLESEKDAKIANWKACQLVH
jgi:hypothetical protein